ncbi:hypothetical protein PV325_012241 [Microctonus aethiopoides]|nr:hypothetical protein PV325_012241 [Microctonus aethiopoides]
MNELGYYSNTLMFHPAGHLLQKLLYRHPSVTEPVRILTEADSIIKAVETTHYSTTPMLRGTLLSLLPWAAWAMTVPQLDRNAALWLE